MKSRYCYCPMTAKRIGRRMTIAERFRRWRKVRRDMREMVPYPFTDYGSPVYPGK